MATINTLKLSSTDVFQIIDAINSRVSSYQYTARYLLGEDEANDNLMIEECNGSFEAEEIARHFQDIIKTIEKQI